MTPDVFISYAPDDASFVAQLRQRLNDRGITTWLEMHDLTAATDRSTAISTAIKDSALFLLILSPESVGYAEVSKQLSFAAGEGKSILPLVWRATELPPAFAYHLSGLQPVRFDGVASSEHFDRLAQIIIDLNGQRSLTNILTQPNRPSLSDWPETGSIQAFRHLYLGGEERPVPFGGRVQTLVALDRWLDQPDQPPYLLLAAPAGRGKSALLVRWTQGLRNQAGDKLTLIFMPVSIRYQTNSAVFVFGELANRLARLHGETRASGIHASAEMLRVEVQTYLQRPLPDGQQLLLVLDGVDEAADWQFGPDLLPVTPPPGLRVLVSARLTAYAPDEAAWLARLAWSSALAQTLSLPPLNPAGVADVLRQMGLPLDQLGDRTEIVAELHRLSEGDPLLVGLYV